MTEAAQAKSGDIRIYVCNMYRELQIGSRIRFKDGLFMTDDPVLQQQIESRGEFGSSIGYQDDLEEMARNGRRIREQEATLRALRKQELLAALEMEDKRGLSQKQKDDREKILAERQRSGVNLLAGLDVTIDGEPKKPDLVNTDERHPDYIPAQGPHDRVIKERSASDQKNHGEGLLSPDDRIPKDLAGQRPLADPGPEMSPTQRAVQEKAKADAEAKAKADKEKADAEAAARAKR